MTQIVTRDPLTQAVTDHLRARGIEAVVSPHISSNTALLVDGSGPGRYVHIGPRHKRSIGAIDEITSELRAGAGPSSAEGGGQELCDVRPVDEPRPTDPAPLVPSVAIAALAMFAVWSVLR
jgi:hypothetical protein